MANQIGGIRRIVKAFGYSMQGFRSAWQHEAAFRQETLLCLALFPASFWVGRGPLDYAILNSALLLVRCLSPTPPRPVETLNTRRTSSPARTTRRRRALLISIS